MHRRVVLGLCCLALIPGALSATFEVPGQEKAMSRLEDMLRLHYRPGPDTTLWDPWIPMSVLWWNTTNAPGVDSMRALYRERLLRRRIDADGYVSSQQHEGLGHSEGWPFPIWTQAGGVGWHFSLAGVPYGREFGITVTDTVTNWTVTGATTVRLDPQSGWTVRVTEGRASLVSPPFRVHSLVAPFLRLKWSTAQALSGRASVEWQIDGTSDFDSSRRMEFALPGAEGVIEDSNIPLYRHAGWGGVLTRFRLTLEELPPGSEITIARLFTAIDTRHNINNAAYLQACDDYVRWTGDIDFLRRNLQRMRLALAWALHEFQIAEKLHVRTPWIGHDGRSGHVVTPEGERQLRPGIGVGNNYWDLLPFGGEDVLATIYYYDAIRRMAAIERQIERHPEWNMPGGPLRFEPVELLKLSEEIQRTGNERFWNETTGRFFGWRDSDGIKHDYGFTFLNNEAIYYGFASVQHARSIREWLDGRGLVEGDASTGSDIYRWRFGPRATTRRNLTSYFWGWSDPGSIPWGGQVQDGGAVLGFSFHDLMARLEVNGADDAWKRLQEILTWFGEVQEAGGYRSYYASGQDGTLQGGGTAGGLGLDHEFFESVLVPQVMLYGFLGFRPRLDGCVLAPHLPRDWPSLTVRNIRLHDVDLDVTALPGRVKLSVRGQPSRPLKVFTPRGDGPQADIREGEIEVVLPN